MLFQIKELIEVEVPADSKIQIYIDIAVKLIKNYLNNVRFTDEDIKIDHELAICLIVSNAINNQTNGVKQIKEGDVSITYFEGKPFQITSDIKALLPTPYIKMF